MITIHAYYHRKTARWRFLLNHAGLWLALFAGFFGSSDTRTLRIPLYKGEPAREAFDMNGVSYHLDYEMELRSFPWNTILMEALPVLLPRCAWVMMRHCWK